MGRFEYIKCFWKFVDDETPLLLFYEVDLENERYATRMIEVFSDKSVKSSDGEGFDFVTEAPIPTIEEINQQSEFYAVIISSDEFDRVYHAKEYPESVDFPKYIMEAKERLSFHSARNVDIHNVKWQTGFLGSLRPFIGELNEDNFHDVMGCLNVLKDELSAPAIDKEMVADIVGIVHLTRAWASPNGMLGRNNILTSEQTKRLLTWVDIIEECFMYLLDNAVEEAFSYYEDYKNGQIEL